MSTLELPQHRREELPAIELLEPAIWFIGLFARAAYTLVEGIVYAIDDAYMSMKAGGGPRVHLRRGGRKFVAWLGTVDGTAVVCAAAAVMWAIAVVTNA